MDALQKLIEELDLERHEEGGYFKRIFTSSINYSKDSNKKIASSIYYLLTSENNIDHLHTCKSDILHYFLEGDPVNYYVLSEKEGLKQHMLDRAHRFLHVPGNHWKASQLNGDQYALIAEVVIPEFYYEDRKIGTIKEIGQLFPHYLNEIKHLINKG